MRATLPLLLLALGALALAPTARADDDDSAGDDDDSALPEEIATYGWLCSTGAPGGAGPAVFVIALAAARRRR